MEILVFLALLPLKSLTICVILLLTLAEEAERSFTAPVHPNLVVHCNAHLSVVSIIGLVIGFILPPGSEAGAAVVRPPVGDSVQADPGLHRVAVLQFVSQRLVLGCAPHTDQVCVVLPAVALRLKPAFLLSHQHVLLWCTI